MDKLGSYLCGYRSKSRLWCIECRCPGTKVLSQRCENQFCDKRVMMTTSIISNPGKRQRGPSSTSLSGLVRTSQSSDNIEGSFKVPKSRTTEQLRSFYKSFFNSSKEPPENARDLSQPGSTCTLEDSLEDLVVGFASTTHSPPHQKVHCISGHLNDEIDAVRSQTTLLSRSGSRTLLTAPVSVVSSQTTICDGDDYGVGLDMCVDEENVTTSRSSRATNKMSPAGTNLNITFPMNMNDNKGHLLSAHWPPLSSNHNSCDHAHDDYHIGVDLCGDDDADEYDSGLAHLTSRSTGSHEASVSLSDIKPSIAGTEVGSCICTSNCTSIGVGTSASGSRSHLRRRKTQFLDLNSLAESLPSMQDIENA